MKKNKGLLLIYVFVFVSIIATVSFSYAYFVTSNKTTGNDKNLNIVTEDLGSIKWQGTKVFTSNDLLPGEMGIQTFTIEKNSNTGKGIYEIDLKGIIDEAFNKDVEITLYKTTDTTNNNVSIEEGSSSLTGVGTLHYAKEDKLKITGTPKVVYGPKALQNKNPIIIEQADFDNSNFNKTTYYLVYHYKNTDVSQDAQQGKSFSGEISVKLILNKTTEEIICDGNEDSASCQIAKLAESNDSLVYDETSDNNLRYIGSNPNNYVSVDGELWRIIGVMNNIDDGTGKSESRIKLIRNESIGNYSWDTSDSSINSGRGVNEWSQADLMKLLNPGYESETVGGSLYWNNESGTCYSENSNKSNKCDFTNTGIKDKLKALISDAIWNTGSQGTNSSRLSKDFYTYERSENTGKICSSSDYCNDTVTRTTTWIGLVGLMYPSDYGYATSGGSTANRATCLNTYLYNWYVDDVSDCHTNDWLYNSVMWQWTLSPTAYSSYAYNAYGIYSSGAVNNRYIISSVGSVLPTVYLSSSVRVISGTGSSSDPYVLGM